MKDSSSQYRERCVSILQKFIARIGDTHRSFLRGQELQAVISTQIENRGKSGKGKGYIAKSRLLTEPITEQMLEPMNHFIKWMQDYLLSCIYVGVPMQRLGISLEFILLLVSMWPADANFSKSLSKTSDAINENLRLLDLIYSPFGTERLLNAFVTTWDEARSLSYKVYKKKRRRRREDHILLIIVKFHITNK